MRDRCCVVTVAWYPHCSFAVVLTGDVCAGPVYCCIPIRTVVNIQHETLPQSDAARAMWLPQKVILPSLISSPYGESTVVDNRNDTVVDNLSANIHQLTADSVVPG